MEGNHSLSKGKVLSWAFYDWATTAFGTVVTTFIFAAYFSSKVASNAIIGTKQWGYTLALAGIIIVLLSPICGAIADNGGRRKPWLAVFTLLTILGSALLWYAYPASQFALHTLIAVMIGTVGIEIGQVFYNALLPNITPTHYLGRVSGWGWGIGYTGGLIALVICLYGFIQTPPSWLNTATAAQVRICGPFIALWIALFSLPLFFWVPDYPATELTISQAIRRGLITLGKTFKNVTKEKNIFLFLIARMVYQDGLNAIFAFGGIYAAGTFGMSIEQVIKFGIDMNIAAGLGAILFAWVDDYIGPKKTILISLTVLLFLSSGMVLVHNVTLFWMLGIVLSLFFGPVQAASRSFLVRLVPRKKVTEMFGLYALTGKATAYVGPWLVAFMTAQFNSQRIGIASVISFFVIGAIMLCWVKSPQS